MLNRSGGSRGDAGDLEFVGRVTSGIKRELNEVFIRDHQCGRCGLRKVNGCDDRNKRTSTPLDPSSLLTLLLLRREVLELTLLVLLALVMLPVLLARPLSLCEDSDLC